MPVMFLQTKINHILHCFSQLIIWFIQTNHLKKVKVVRFMMMDDKEKAASLHVLKAGTSESLGFLSTSGLNNSSAIKIANVVKWPFGVVVFDEYEIVLIN